MSRWGLRWGLRWGARWGAVSAPVVHRLPDNIIVATQDVHDVRRRVVVTPVVRTVTTPRVRRSVRFDG